MHCKPGYSDWVCLERLRALFRLPLPAFCPIDNENSFFMENVAGVYVKLRSELLFSLRLSICGVTPPFHTYSRRGKLEYRTLP